MGGQCCGDVGDIGGLLFLIGLGVNFVDDVCVDCFLLL